MKLTPEVQAEFARRMSIWKRSRELWSLASYSEVIPLLREAVACGWVIYSEELEFIEAAERSGFTLPQCRFMWSWIRRISADAADG